MCAQGYFLKASNEESANKNSQKQTKNRTEFILLNIVGFNNTQKPNIIKFEFEEYISNLTIVFRFIPTSSRPTQFPFPSHCHFASPFYVYTQFF
jgi:hypothetical protein